MLICRTDWPSAKQVLADTHFLERLIAYPKDDISDKLLKKLQDYVAHPEFVPQAVAKQSKVCKSMCIWVRAIDGYAKIFRVVEPKRAKCVNLENIIAETNILPDSLAHYKLRVIHNNL